MASTISTKSLKMLKLVNYALKLVPDPATMKAETGDDSMTTSTMTTALQFLQQYLLQEEREEGTIEKYLRDAARFLAWMGEEYPTDVPSWKERLALLMEAICATGIRVSEVRYLTVEAAWVGRTEISFHTILLPGKLCRKLLKYALAIFKNSNISIRHRNPYIKAFCGLQRKLFLRIAIRKTKSPPGRFSHQRRGNGLSRRQIWSEMKAICKSAGVAESQSLFKVFPHNLRHLFARTFYKVCRAVARLADLLGHSSIETTRIYLISTGVEHTRQLERLNLIC